VTFDISMRHPFFGRVKINVFFIEDKNDFGPQKILLTEKHLPVNSLVYE